MLGKHVKAGFYSPPRPHFLPASAADTKNAPGQDPEAFCVLGRNEKEA